MMHTVEFAATPDKPQAAFVILYAPASADALQTAACLLIDRGDGTIGFPGGYVESDETLEEGASREAYEETGHRIVGPLEPVVAHDLGSLATYAFMSPISRRDLDHIRTSLIHAPHFGIETAGAVIATLSPAPSKHADGLNLIDLLRAPLIGSTRREIAHFLLQAHLIGRATLAVVCAEAGYDLDELLT